MNSTIDYVEQNRTHFTSLGHLRIHALILTITARSGSRPLKSGFEVLSMFLFSRSLKLKIDSNYKVH